MKISADFPGGNIIVREIQGDRARITQDLRNCETYWFYWCMAVEFDRPGRYTFAFEHDCSIGARGPAMRLCNDTVWSWLGCANVDYAHNEFFYDCAAPERVIFCTSMQYLESDFLRFAAAAGHPAEVLCRSRRGRDVELFHIRDGAPAKKILLTTRHHACEMTAAHVLEGILRTVLADDETGRMFRREFELFAVPFVDKDGVEEGDQGKNRIPHDHARDYGDTPIYPETRSIMALIEREKPEIVFDLHCPWLLGGINETLYFVGPELKRMELQMMRWSEILQKEVPPSVPFDPADNILFGTDWNVPSSFMKGRTLARWAADLDYVKTALSIEIPYANMRDTTFNVKSMHELGAALVRTIYGAAVE